MSVLGGGGYQGLLRLVYPPKPEVDDMLASLDKLREQVAAGEFETIWIIAHTHDRKLITVERGKPLGRLFKIGALECFKNDLITCMETGEGTGL